MFDNSPAKGSGLIAGDLIVNVDGKDTKGVSPEEVASLLRGEKGTKASIRVQRGDKNFDYIVIREPFKFKAVTGSRQNVKGKEVAFLSIRSFDFSTCDNIVALLSEMKQKGPIDSIVLDLRNNGGGLLQGAVQTSNVFLPPGKTVVFITGKDGESKAQNTLPNGLSTQDSNIPDTRTKMYIVINKNTASAAEVLAAGLKVITLRSLTHTHTITLMDFNYTLNVGKRSSYSSWGKIFWKRSHTKSSGVAFRKWCGCNHG